MAENKALTVTWRIKNFSFCWQEEAGEFSGPTFSIEGKDGIKFTLILFPQSTRSKEIGTINCYFYLESEENGPHEVEISYEISALGSDGLPLATASRTNSKMRGNDWSSPLILLKSTVFIEKPDEFLPKDSLTIRCRIWQINQKNINAERYFATTRIELEKVSLLGVLKKVCFSLYGDCYHAELISLSTEISPICINIRVIRGIPYAEIQPGNCEFVKFCKCKICIVDSKGNEIICGQDECLFRFDTLPLEEKMQKWVFPLKIKNENDSSKPYPKLEDKFLRCEITYSTEIISEKFEKIDYSISTFQNGCRLIEKRQNHLLSLKDDMFSLLTNADNCDIQLKTKNKTFPAHSIILSARSLFFRNKLDKHNKENTIYIDDLDKETLYQMLVFLYTDTIENLESKNAMNLYIASGRYGIPSLNHKCACFLQNNLDVSICCDALQSADQYRDGDLKKAAMNYILEHADEVIGSDKWQDLKLFTELTEEVLCLKSLKSEENKGMDWPLDECFNSAKIDPANVSSLTCN